MALCLLLFSCSKEEKPQPTPTPPPVDNGPIGGTYTLTGIVYISYDTIYGSGLTTMNQYNTSCTNIKGSATVSATSINSKGLMYDFTTNGTKKEVITSTGATTTTNNTPITGSRGVGTSSVTSNYSINTTAGELTIDDAQYLFNPAFTSQPANKKHKYALAGNTLKVTTEQYDASTKFRSVNEATFTKQ
jgi:hypothetical protein